MTDPTPSGLPQPQTGTLWCDSDIGPGEPVKRAPKPSDSDIEEAIAEVHKRMYPHEYGYADSLVRKGVQLAQRLALSAPAVEPVAVMEAPRSLDLTNDQIDGILHANGWTRDGMSGERKEKIRDSFRRTLNDAARCAHLPVAPKAEPTEAKALSWKEEQARFFGVQPEDIPASPHDDATPQADSAVQASAQEAAPTEPDMRAVCEALGFDPTNHHNAAKCPYCRPATPAPVAADTLTPTVEQAIAFLKIALRDSKGWTMGYSDSIIRDAIDRTREADALAAIKALQDRLDTLNSSLECEKRMRKDAEENAERYRWLRTYPNNVNAAVYGPTGGLLRRDEYLDAAIDKAMEKAR